MIGVDEDDGFRVCQCGRHEYDAYGRTEWPPCEPRECDVCGKQALLVRADDGIADVCSECKRKEEEINGNEA